METQWVPSARDGVRMGWGVGCGVSDIHHGRARRENTVTHQVARGTKGVGCKGIGNRLAKGPRASREKEARGSSNVTAGEKRIDSSHPKHGATRVTRALSLFSTLQLAPKNSPQSGEEARVCVSVLESAE